MQYSREVLHYKQKQMDKLMPIKLQAYERLAMFCERISIDTLSYRLSSGSTEAKHLSNAMMIAIQQEYEHNLSQQVYVSSKLWEIITIVKNQMQEIISDASKDPSIGTSPAALVAKAYEIQNSMGGSPLAKAKRAIKEEVDIIL